MKKALFAPLLALVLALSACATWVAPQTPEHKVFAAHGAYIAVSRTTADYLRSGLITVERAKQINAKLDKWAPTIITARERVMAGKPVGFERLARIENIQAALQALQDYLEARHDGT